MRPIYECVSCLFTESDYSQAQQGLLSPVTTPPPQNFPMLPWEKVDGLWATNSEGVGQIVRAISFQDVQPM